MSGHNKKGQKTGSEVVIGDGKHHLRDDVPRVTLLLKRLGVVCGIILVCAVVAGLVWHFAKDKKPAARHTTTTAQKDQTASPAKLTPEQQYHTMADTGDYAGAEQALESQLASAKDTLSKLEVYSQQSAVALQFKKYDDAKKYADKAMQLDPNSDIPYSALAYWAQAQGNVSAAKNYWQQAISKLDASAPQYALVKEQYQRDIQGLNQ